MIQSLETEKIMQQLLRNVHMHRYNYSLWCNPSLQKENGCFNHGVVTL